MTVASTRSGQHWPPPPPRRPDPLLPPPPPQRPSSDNAMVPPPPPLPPPAGNQQWQRRQGNFEKNDWRHHRPAESRAGSSMSNLEESLFTNNHYRTDDSLPSLLLDDDNEEVDIGDNDDSTALLNDSFSDDSLFHLAKQVQSRDRDQSFTDSLKDTSSTSISVQEINTNPEFLVRQLMEASSNALNRAADNDKAASAVAKFHHMESILNILHSTNDLIENADFVLDMLELAREEEEDQTNESLIESLRDMLRSSRNFNDGDRDGAADPSSNLRCSPSASPCSPKLPPPPPPPRRNNINFDSSNKINNNVEANRISETRGRCYHRFVNNNILEPLPCRQNKDPTEMGKPNANPPSPWLQPPPPPRWQNTSVKGRLHGGDPRPANCTEHETRKDDGNNNQVGWRGGEKIERSDSVGGRYNTGYENVIYSMASQLNDTPKKYNSPLKKGADDWQCKERLPMSDQCAMRDRGMVSKLGIAASTNDSHNSSNYNNSFKIRGETIQGSNDGGPHQALPHCPTANQQDCHYRENNKTSAVGSSRNGSHDRNNHGKSYRNLSQEVMTQRSSGRRLRPELLQQLSPANQLDLHHRHNVKIDADSSNRSACHGGNNYDNSAGNFSHAESGQGSHGGGLRRELPQQVEVADQRDHHHFQEGKTCVSSLRRKGSLGSSTCDIRFGNLSQGDLSQRSNGVESHKDLQQCQPTEQRTSSYHHCRNNVNMENGRSGGEDGGGSSSRYRAGSQEVKKDNNNLGEQDFDKRSDSILAMANRLDASKMELDDPSIIEGVSDPQYWEGVRGNSRRIQRQQMRGSGQVIRGIRHPVRKNRQVLSPSEQRRLHHENRKQMKLHDKKLQKQQQEQESNGAKSLPKIKGKVNDNSAYHHQEQWPVAKRQQQRQRETAAAGPQQKRTSFLNRLKRGKKKHHKANISSPLAATELRLNELTCNSTASLLSSNDSRSTRSGWSMRSGRSVKSNRSIKSGRSNQSGKSAKSNFSAASKLSAVSAISRKSSVSTSSKKSTSLMFSWIPKPVGGKNPTKEQKQLHQQQLSSEDLPIIPQKSDRALSLNQSNLMSSSKSSNKRRDYCDQLSRTLPYISDDTMQQQGGSSATRSIGSNATPFLEEALLVKQKDNGDVVPLSIGDYISTSDSLGKLSSCASSVSTHSTKNGADMHDEYGDDESYYNDDESSASSFVRVVSVAEAIKHLNKKNKLAKMAAAAKSGLGLKRI